MIFFWVLVAHVIGDGVFQSPMMKQMKSQSLYWLFLHAGVYGFFLLPFGVNYALTNAVLHAIVDSCTSQITRLCYLQRDWDMYYSVKLMDQMVHILILFATLEK